MNYDVKIKLVVLVVKFDLVKLPGALISFRGSGFVFLISYVL